jgi:hypothetical protein
MQCAVRLFCEKKEAAITGGFFFVSQIRFLAVVAVVVDA